MKGNSTSLGQKVFLSAITIFTIFYTVLLYQIVWNWFIADYFFVIGYWQMFLGAIVARYILLPTKKYSNVKIENEKAESLPFETRVEDRTYRIIFETIGFGLFFLVNLIISYYS